MVRSKQSPAAWLRMALALLVFLAVLGPIPSFANAPIVKPDWTVHEGDPDGGEYDIAAPQNNHTAIVPAADHGKAPLVRQPSAVTPAATNRAADDRNDWTSLLVRFPWLYFLLLHV